jgi:hypothetical protein
MGAVTGPSDRFGWILPSERSAAVQRQVEEVIGGMPSFFVAGQSRSTARVRLVLWEYARRVNGGKHLPTFRQEVGDCVSQGAANAVNYLSAMEIVRLSEGERYRPAFQPYIYGISRVQIGGGRLGNSDGSVGAWAAEGVRRFGILAADDGDVPRYSGSLARQWGRGVGPPAEFVERARPHVVRSTSLVTRYEQVRDALANGYPVTVASNQGFQMRPRVDRGKAWGVPSGSWAHQMCLIGVDDDPVRPGCYCLNSWGEEAHGSPAGDEPPGGFWVDAETVTRMTRQQDSFAFSQFEGFPEQDLDFRLVG